MRSASSELGGGAGADVRQEQLLLDLVPVVLGERVAGQDGQQPGAQGRAGARETITEPHEAAGGGGRRLDGRLAG